MNVIGLSNFFTNTQSWQSWQQRLSQQNFQQQKVIFQWGLIQQTLVCQFTALPTELLRHVVVRILFRFYFQFLLIALLPPAIEVCDKVMFLLACVILFTEEVSV